jgi:hypothetical protein
MRVEVVSGCSPDGFALYGQACVDSFLAHWPAPLTVYFDQPMAVHGITNEYTHEIAGWRKTMGGLSFRNRHAEKPASYLWNARRYAVKVFIWRAAAKRLGQGILVWLDADTVTTSDVPKTLIPEMLGEADVAYLGRGSMHPENGCVIFRIPEALPLLAWCQKAYEGHRYRKWVDGWTDCHVLRRGLQAVPVHARDLTSRRHRGTWRSHVDAFALSPLGAHVSHLKGGRQKVEGRVIGLHEYKPSYIEKALGAVS